MHSYHPVDGRARRTAQRCLIGGMTDDERGFPRDRYGLIRRAGLLAGGVSDQQICQLVERGVLVRLARGAFAPASAIDPNDGKTAAEAALERHRLRAIAVVTGCHSGGATIVSHQSAAAIHDLPMLYPPLERVHLTNGEIGGGEVNKTTRVHASELASGDVVTVDGISVTSLARTAADVAQSIPADRPLAFAQALVVLDAALHRGVLAGELALQFRRRRRCGTRVAKRALEWADGLAESPGESWGRAQMIEAGLPVPALQVKHVIDGETFRVDGEWSGGLVWEFDGMSKYGRHRRAGESVADAVLREKRREDTLRSTGLRVIRTWWSMHERRTAVPLIARVLDELRLR